MLVRTPFGRAVHAVGADAAGARKAGLLADYQRAGAEKGWHFLVGDQANIERVAKAVGFRYHYDESIQQWAHPSVLMIAKPDGTVGFASGFQDGCTEDDYSAAIANAAPARMSGARTGAPASPSTTLTPMVRNSVSETGLGTTLRTVAGANCSSSSKRRCVSPRKPFANGSSR